MCYIIPKPASFQLPPQRFKRAIIYGLLSNSKSLSLVGHRGKGRKPSPGVFNSCRSDATVYNFYHKLSCIVIPEIAAKVCLHGFPTRICQVALITSGFMAAYDVTTTPAVV